jgi:hypothetical protein
MSNWNWLLYWENSNCQGQLGSKGILAFQSLGTFWPKGFGSTAFRRNQKRRRRMRRGMAWHGLAGLVVFEKL